MKLGKMALSCALLLILAGVGGCGATPEPSATSTPEAYTDPFAYCAAVGTIDVPGAAYTGPAVPPSVAQGLQTALNAPDTPLEILQSGSTWRCMDGEVYACFVGANLPCDAKADTDRTPTQDEIDFCQANPDSEFIPAVATGRETVFEWRCKEGAPEIVRQVFQPDAQGFLSDFWYKIIPPEAAADMPNPASEFCVEQGYQLEIRSEAGGEVGYCLFPDGSECEEWAFYRGECVGPGVASPTHLDPGGGAGQLVFDSTRGSGYRDLYQVYSGGEGVARLTEGEADNIAGPYSPDGTRIVYTAFGLTTSDIWVINADPVAGTDASSQVNLTNTPDVDEGFPAWSPDGTHIAFTTRRDGNNEIYVMNADGTNPTRWTDNPGDDFAPAWSPDGTQIAFVSDRDREAGIYDLYIMDAVSSAVTRLTDDEYIDYSPAWSPDGTRIAFRSHHGGPADIYVINADGSGLRNLTENPADDWAPSWSPDGSLIAFQTNRDGNWEVYLMNADGSGPENLTQNPADDQMPYWRP